MNTANTPSKRPTGSKTVPPRPTNAAPARPPYPFGAMRVESQPLRSVPSVAPSQRDQSNRMTVYINGITRPQGGAQIPNHQMGYRSSVLTSLALSQAGGHSKFPGTPQVLQARPQQFVPAAVTHTHQSPISAANTRIEVTRQRGRGRPRTGGKRPRQAIAQSKHDQNGNAHPRPPAAGKQPTPKRRLTKPMAKATPARTRPDYDSDEYTPTSRRNHRSSIRGGAASEDAARLFQEDSSEQDTPRQSIDEDSTTYSTGPSTSCPTLGDQDGTQASSQPPNTTIVNGFPCTADPVTGHLVASYSGPYSVPPQLQGVRQALGESTWKEYVVLIEKLVDGTIDNEVFLRAEREMYMFPKDQREKLTAKMRAMVTAIRQPPVPC